MKLRITVLPGDGIGPEVTREAVRVLRTVADVQGYEFTFDERAIGGVAIRECGMPLPPDTLESCRKSDAVLLGAVGAPEFDALPPEKRCETGLLALRRGLGGFANLRPAVCHPAIADCSPLRPEVVRGADILFVRELLGGIYFGEPRGCDGAAAFNTMRYTEPEIERVARIAFDLARQRRKKLTSVDKANVLETSQLWRRTVTRLGSEYPEVALEHCLVDACAMKLVTSPASFDVVLTENLFGDILSDEAAAIAGSLGMLASASIGGAVGLYEPVHGSAPDIAGRGIANPLGAIASAALLLRYSAQLPEDASAIERAIGDVLNAGYRTPDIRRNGSKFTIKTADMGKVVAEAVVQVLEREHAYHAV
ncbi:MAG TPA: 3-isopropylmalate dehydrogenase [Terriglobales bacterium]|nr:3-isopropylmalate dehydrogenase [Terriglobales bacterium]